ncbi:MAG: hypothetical protein ACRCZO_15115 [Cetobacterium sp.]|uniref:hypothetical protein n=1 Tax=Cetobacterium sp. TaxID=2071632 RepID=UPI003EE75FB6
MTLRDILIKQRYQRYKSVIFLVSLENSEFISVKEVFEKEDYDLIDIYDEIQNNKFDFQEFIIKKLDYLKKYFNKKEITSKLMIINNIEILMSTLDDDEFKNFIIQLSFDNYIDNKKNQVIFLMPDILKYRTIEMKNQDDDFSRIYKIENIKL